MKIPPNPAVYRGSVPFHDCDPLGIVWHGHYSKYLENARTELMKRHRLDVPDFMELGFKLMVTESRLRYSFPLRYGDDYEVKAWFVDIEQRLRIGYQVWNQTHDKRSARAHTTLVTTDPEGNMLWETPHEVVTRIRA